MDCGPILLVDADDVSRESVSAALRHAGYAVREATSGLESLEIARAERPATVILDVELEDMSGYEVCRALRNEFGELLPIVLCSGARTNATDRIAGLLIGADDYLVKPLVVGELVAKVYRLAIRSQPVVSSNTGTSGAEAAGLTEREQEILCLLAQGLASGVISKELGISPRTVSTHIQHVLSKLGAHSRGEAVAIAYRNRLVPGADESASLTPEVVHLPDRSQSLRRRSSARS